MSAPTTPGEAIAGRLLSGAPDVAALVGSRIFPSKPTQDAQGDYVVYFRTGGGGNTALGGRIGLQAYEMRVECYARTAGSADAILAAVVARLAGPPAWRDRPNGVQGCFPVGDADEQVLDDGDQVSGQTFSLWFKPQA